MINFIVNIRSGKGRGNKALKKILAYCGEHNIENTIHITDSPTHATRIAKVLCEQGAKTIVAVGGDGTFSEVLNGVDFDTTVLGFIPAGRGNDYARAAKLSLNPIKALEDIVRGEVVASDYIAVSSRRCLNVTGSGLDVAVLNLVDDTKGKLSYFKSLFKCLQNYTPFSFDITIDGVKHSHDCIMVGVCNGVAFGGGINLSPESKLDDGKLNVIIMLPPKNLLSALLKFKKGANMDKPYTKHFVCEEVSVVCTKEPQPIQIDGEIFDNLTLDCCIVKGGMKTFKVG